MGKKQRLVYFGNSDANKISQHGWKTIATGLKSDKNYFSIKLNNEAFSSLPSLSCLQSLISEDLALTLAMQPDSTA